MRDPRLFSPQPLLVLLLVAGAACGEASPPSAPDSGLASDLQPATPGFAADPRPGGAALYLGVEDPGGSPRLELWASGLGAVFGLAARVALDPARLGAANAKPTTWLGPEAPKEARYLTLAAEGIIVLGAARRGPAAGERQLDAPTLLATAELVVRAAGRSRLELREVQVRRADGSFVPVAVAGGELTTGGAR